MRVTIIQVGKTKQSWFKEAEAEYLKRLQPYAKMNIVTLNEAVVPNGDSDAGRKQVKKKEAAEILKHISDGSYVIALDEHGEQMGSVDLANFLKKQRDFEGADITFIIGGSYGLDETVLTAAKKKLALSKLTFTHEMVRTILLEQIYRAFTIITGKIYHY